MRRLVILLVAVMGCVPANGQHRDHGPDEGIGTQDEDPPQRVFIRVKVRGGQCPFVLEQAIGGVRSFNAGWIKLYSDAKWSIPIMQLGALPVGSGVFTLWDGNKPREDSKTLELVIPRAGGPWRGIVAELCDGIRYPGILFQPVPGQPPGGERPVFTEIFHCSTANILTCVPWHQAVVHELVRCEDRRGNPISTEWCSFFVPFTKWDVSERP